MEIEVCDDQLIQKGLRTIGRHPLLQVHTFLEICLNSANISSINNLGNFPNVMYVDISNNCVEDLSPLALLPTLVQLDASNNNLTECLAFAPPRCSSANALSTGHSAVGSMLTLANLSVNSITKIHSLENHIFLECLLLSQNKLTHIEGLSELKYLLVLDLSFNAITEITGLDGLPIQELNLKGNEITELCGVELLPCLTSLDIGYNKISCLKPLESCLQLNLVDIRNNSVESINEVGYMAGLSWIRSLVLSDNPCCAKKYYRPRIIFWLPQLFQLDLSDISAEDKVAAANLHRHNSGDIESRKIVFEKYFPDEVFVNQSEHITDLS